MIIGGNYMIFFLNQKEVFMGYSMKDFSDVRFKLSSSGIKYKVKTVNQSSSTMMGSDRARSGSYGLNQAYNYIYYVYVHKMDYEKALSIIKS